ncbi:MAG: hypothetical protein WAS36_05275 [Candidatus Saccharimonadales bacterium]
MGNFELSPSQFSRGGIELTHLVNRGDPQRHVVPGPESLQDQSQLDDMIEVGELSLELLGGQFNQIGAPRTNDGFILRFMTNLVVDNEADGFATTDTSEWLTATRQPRHPTTVVYRRILKTDGQFSELDLPVNYRRNDVQRGLYQPLKNNIELAKVCHTVANPIRQLAILKADFAKLKAEQDAITTRTIFAIGNVSLTVRSKN